MQEYHSDNVFAMILRGEIPCHKTIETGEVLGFMDINPRSHGHSLVIPKQPARNLLDCSDTSLQSVIVATKKVARAAIAAFGADGVLINQLNEAEAGQEVFHLHFHVIPRFANIPLGKRSVSPPDHTKLAALASQLRNALAQYE